MYFYACCSPESYPVIYCMVMATIRVPDCGPYPLTILRYSTIDICIAFGLSYYFMFSLYFQPRKT